jgi:hypothetical protein
MSLLRKLGLAALIAVCGPWSASQAGVYVGVGVPLYRPYYRPCHGYGYYRPYGFGLYVAPPPVVVAPPPVVYQPAVVQQPVVVQPAYAPPAQAPALLQPPAASTAAPPPPADVMPTAATAAVSNRANEFDACLQQVQTGDEPTRADALVRLGRLQDARAVGPMVKALNSDPSPRVREAAARGLGLIASPSALSALQYAAQSDDDREVRHSASFAAEVIRGNLRR